jgi:hypothetical protein
MSGVRLQGCGDALTWETGNSLIPSRRRLDDIPRIQLEFGEKSRAFWLTLSENRPGSDENTLMTSAADH